MNWHFWYEGCRYILRAATDAYGVFVVEALEQGEHDECNAEARALSIWLRGERPSTWNAAISSLESIGGIFQ